MAQFLFNNCIPLKDNMDGWIRLATAARLIDRPVVALSFRFEELMEKKPLEFTSVDAFRTILICSSIGAPELLLLFDANVVSIAGLRVMQLRNILTNSLLMLI
jgi:hypothetical protein